MKIFCTGNVEKKSIAFGLDQITNITSASISTGWDFNNKETIKKFNATKVDSIDEVLSKGDFVSLHCPSTPETKHLIDQEALATMGSHAFLINTARGEVVDERALANALSEGEIAGAGLDVYENEPSINPALLKFENLVLLPHMGSGTNETREAMGMRVFDNIKAFFEGAEPRDRVV